MNQDYDAYALMVLRVIEEDVVLDVIVLQDISQS
jgi:hypothetical protein